VILIEQDIKRDYCGLGLLIRLIQLAFKIINGASLTVKSC
jgi:hypothetical protein